MHMERGKTPRPWRGYLQLMRPHQWLKSGFVLIGYVSSREWTNTALLFQALAAAAFSLT